MGALFGIWHFDQRDGGRDACVKMARNLEPYSSNRTRISTHDGVAMGENFVALMPEDRAATQPFRSSDDRFLMVVDGWVDNREDILADLGLAPSCSDARLVFEGFLKWGPECCDRIHGGFVFAVWDAVTQQLIFGREVQGQRPLFYHVNAANGFVAFASMPSALHTLPDVPRAPDYAELEYAAATLKRHLDRTYLEGINRVPARHVTTIDRESVTHSLYWTPDLSRLDLPSSEDYIALVRQTFSSALASALRGHTDAASLMSAGHDSSYVALSAAKMLAQNGGRIAAFTSAPREGFADSSTRRLTDESGIAGQLADLAPNLDHHIIRPNEESYIDLVTAAVGSLQSSAFEPINGRWYHLICQEVSQQGHRLLLDGHMGNLTFSHNGQLGLFDDLSDRRFLAFVRKAVTGLARRQIGVRTFASILASHVFRRKMRSVFTPRRSDPYLIAKPEAIATHGSHVLRGADSHQGALLKLYSDLDYDTWPFHAWKEYGLTVRDPFVDRRMLELSLRLPSSVHQFDGAPRAVSRHLLAEYVPAGLLSQLTRGLQGADWHEAFAKEIDRYRDCFADLKQHPDVGKVVDLERLGRLLDAFPENGHNTFETSARYRANIHQAISVGRFVQAFSPSNAAPPPRS